MSSEIDREKLRFEIASAMLNPFSPHSPSVSDLNIAEHIIKRIELLSTKEICDLRILEKLESTFGFPNTWRSADELGETQSNLDVLTSEGLVERCPEYRITHVGHEALKNAKWFRDVFKLVLEDECRNGSK